MSNPNQPLVRQQTGPYGNSSNTYQGGQPPRGPPSQQGEPQYRQGTVDIGSACSRCMSDPGRLLFMLMGIACFLTWTTLIVGLGSNSWTTYTSGSQTTNIGLWEVCISSTTVTGVPPNQSAQTEATCSSIDTDCEVSFSGESGKVVTGDMCSKFQAARAFSIMSVFPLLVPILVALVASCNFCAGHTRRICFIVAPIFQFAGVLMGIICVGVYAGLMNSSPNGNDGGLASLCGDPLELSDCTNFGFSYGVYATAVTVSFFLSCMWFPMLCSPTLAPKKSLSSQYAGYGAHAAAHGAYPYSGASSAASSVSREQVAAEEKMVQ